MAVPGEQTMPCVKRMANRIPKAGPLPRFTVLLDPTLIAVVII